MNNTGHAISPVDGRYRNKVEELADIFSEFALMKYRLLIEVEYLIYLSDLKICRGITTEERAALKKLYVTFSDEDFTRILAIEKVVNHDVKAVVDFLIENMKGNRLEDLIPFVHFGRTSEDINNLAYGFMLKSGKDILADYYGRIHTKLRDRAQEYKKIPLLALTHGQPASPTTLGWEMMVYAERMSPELSALTGFSISVKCNGATGGDNAAYVAYPDVNWREVSQGFVLCLNTQFGCRFIHNMFTTQIEPHDTYANLFCTMKRMNNILLDLSKDVWGYISRNVFVEKVKEGEVGSSAMPGKVNPLDWENAEGNLGMANALFNFFADKLTQSRFQRDLSDSTVERNFGVAFAHVLVALKSILKGFDKAVVNQKAINEELAKNWIIVAEAYQTILRREGIADAYKILLTLTRGKIVTKKIMHNFVDSLVASHKASPVLIRQLKKITPFNYIGNRDF